MADFFISYRGTDVHWAQWIAWQLQQAGSSVIYQAADFRAGPPLIDQINQALTSARCTIAVISPDYFDSPWCKIEWQTAYTLEVIDGTHRLLLVVIKPSDLPSVLKARTWLELTGLDEPTAKERLLSAIGDPKKPDRLPVMFPGNHDYYVPSFRELIAHESPIPGLAAISPPDRFPGRSNIWNVPHPWNPNFVGRDGLLAELRKSLVAGDRAAVTQAVTGLGGVGKTQLATMYAYQHAADYELVWWVNSESPAGLAADFAALAGPLGLPEQDEWDLNVKAQAVRRRLEEFSCWLVIFDNVEDPEHLTGYLPQNAQGHVIITSRHPHWRHIAQPLVVPTLARPDAVELLHRRSGQQDPVAADKLADLLGDLPVALVQAAGYIERTNKSIAAYLDLFQQHRARLWKKDKRPDGYQRTVAETLTLSLAKVTQHSRAAADLLRLCAYLAPDKIPLDILSQHADEVEGRLGKVLADPVELDAALAELRSYSLVEVSELKPEASRRAGSVMTPVSTLVELSDSAPVLKPEAPAKVPLPSFAGASGFNSNRPATGPYLSMHRLVQTVVRDRLRPAAQKTWCAAAVRILDAAFPKDILTNLNSWPLCDRLADHALVATEHAERLGSMPEQAVRLAGTAGVHLDQRAQFEVAELAKRRALAIAERALGPQHPELAIQLNNMVALLWATNRLAEAEPLMRRALAIGEQSFGPEHPKVALRLNNLALLLKDTNRLAEAEPLMRRALAIWEQSVGTDHPQVAIGLNNLAQLLQATNRLEEAEPLMRRALAIDEQSFGPEHPTVAIRLNNLALLLQDTNRLSEAEPLMRRAVDILVASLGNQHPKTVGTRDNLDRLLQTLGKPEENIE